jgi:hypothetical protein
LVEHAVRLSPATPAAAATATALRNSGADIVLPFGNSGCVIGALR